MSNLKKLRKCVCGHCCIFSDTDKYNCFANQVATRVMDKRNNRRVKGVLYMNKEEQVKEIAKDIPFLTLERVLHRIDRTVAHRWTLSEEDTIAIAEALYDKGYRKESEIARGILQKLKAWAVDKYDYFGKLRAKNLEHNGCAQDSDVNNENATFDLGEMDAFNCIIDRIKQLAGECGMELVDEGNSRRSPLRHSSTVEP